MKILKIIAEICRGDKKLSACTHDVLRKSLNRADNMQTDVSYGVIQQCIYTITQIFPDNDLLDMAESAIRKFLNSKQKKNLIYLGMKALKQITELNSKYIQNH